MVLMSYCLNLWYWSLTSALFNGLILGGAAIELLDRSVLLESPDVLSLSILACICSCYTWSRSLFIHSRIWNRYIHAILVSKAGWNFQGVLGAILLFFLYAIPDVLYLSINHILLTVVSTHHLHITFKLLVMVWSLIHFNHIIWKTPCTF